ncbi:MAG TPA: glycoside hydrolase family 27 protein [Vicinamibacteria bacterium]
MRRTRLNVLLLLCAVATACTGGRDLTGKWVVVERAPGPEGGPGAGPMTDAVLDLHQDRSALTGTLVTHMLDLPLAKGTIRGNEISFVVSLDLPSGKTEIPFTGRRAEGGIELTARPPAGMPPMSVLLVRASEEEVLRRTGSKPERIEPPEIQPLADDGLARTPPMGWNSWNCFHLDISDAKVREIADALVKTGMRDAGYRYLVIDDGWQGKRDEKGVLHPNERFPDMKALADYVHGKGLKLGIYSSPGHRTCGNKEGSYGHEEQDARMFADWGVDYLKYDWCGAFRIYKNEEMQAVYQKMGAILRGTGRPIVYGLCQYGLVDVWKWGPAAGGHLWRTTGDIADTWESMEQIGFSQGELAPWAGPGRWNDPDMLEVGNGGMTHAEYRTHMSLWSLLAAPLLAGNDLRAMTPETIELLTNPEVIAIDQDPLGRQGRRVSRDGPAEVWSRPLADGRLAAGLFNRGAEAAPVTARWADLGLRGRVRVRDAWARKDLGAFADRFTVDVPAHGVALLVLQGR